MTRIAALAAALALLVLAGCGGGDDGSDAGEPETVATAPAEESERAQGDEAEAEKDEKPERTGSVVEVSESQFGTILTDADGRALYMFDKEQSERSECFGACAEAWPPFFTKGEPQAKGAVRQGQLGTTKHGDKRMVTYNDHPLYYYVDEGPNEVRCHNVSEFGGLWLVVGPNGDPRP